MGNVCISSGCFTGEQGFADNIKYFVGQLFIKYRKPAKIGDILQIETQIESRLSHSFQISQKVVIEKSNELALEAVVTSVFVDGKGQPKLIDPDILRIWPDLAAVDCPERNLT